jgi:hypothetical protein
MQAVKLLQVSYVLMDPAFLRQVVSDAGDASDTETPAWQASRAPWRTWCGETAARFSALAAGIAKGHRGFTAPTPHE